MTRSFKTGGLAACGVMAALAAAAAIPAGAQPREVKNSDFICNGLDSRDVLRSIDHWSPRTGAAREGVFYFHGDEESLPALEAGLSELGFAVRRTRTAPGRIAAVNTAINEAWLAENMPQICQLAADVGVEYDGWGITVPEALDPKKGE